MSDPDLSQLPTKGSEKTETPRDQTTLTDPQSSPASAGFPGRIGRYQILRRLGRGGMGEVFEAEQTEPVHRKVALKLIKGGMDTQEVLARFDSERQALALMNHLNIARMLDAGATEQQRPYFVMEFIQGVPITEYCDSQELSTSQRLELFVQVCDGVQHAHQKGIVHRDIKPSNVLVTVEDQKVIPKIIDFGLAKALGSGDADMTQFTHIGQVIGTPTYMSPEQVSGSDIDTRTDVYSLGVLLYQLLVGTVPFDLKVTPQEGWDAFRKKIREQEPVRPSVRSSSLGDSSPETAKKRRIDAASWSRELRGDLDWITLRALEKDRTGRYQSPSELAADITRHLKHEPVLASPPSTIYRLRKFVRRHRVGVAAAAVVALALIAGITGTTIGLIRATRAERKAVEEAENTRQLSDFLLGLFRVSDPSEARGNTITAREILDRGAQKIERELGGRPVIKAEMMRTMGEVYISLGLYKQAQPLLEKSLVIARTAGSDNLGIQSNTLLQLAAFYIGQGKSHEALPLAQEGLRLRERVLGPEHPEVARGLLIVGIIYRNTGKLAEAKGFLERSLAIREKTLGPEHADTLDSLFHLAWLHNLMHNFKEAAKCYERILIIREKLGPGQPEVARALSDLGIVRSNMGDYAEALKLYQQALAIREKVLGPNHKDVGDSVNNIGTALWNLGRFHEARPYYQRALGIMEKAFGPEHPAVAEILRNLALLLNALGEEEKARPLYERTLAIQEKASGADSPQLTGILTDFGWLLYEIGEYDKSRLVFIRALNLREKAGGPGNARIAYTLMLLGDLYRDTGHYRAAQSVYERALKIQEKFDPSNMANTLTGLAHMHSDNGNYEQAVASYERALQMLEQMGSQRGVSVILARLAELYRMHHQYERARMGYERAAAIREEALAAKEKSSGPKDPEVANTLIFLAELHGDTGDYEKALILYKRALSILEQTQDPKLPGVLHAAGNLYQKNQSYSAAQPLYRRALAMEAEKRGADSWAVATILVDMGRLEIAQSKFAEAESLFRQATAITQKIQGETPIFSYDQACYSALLNDRDQAIYYLKQAVARGFDSKYKIAHDSNLASLHGDPEFEAILKSVP
jgi:eukaryotic-like serine/threonine-protein kinase